MKSKIFKPLLFILAALFAANAGFAQNTNVAVTTKASSVSVNTRFNDKDFQVAMDDLNKELKAGLKDLGKTISLTVNNVTSKMNLDLGDLGSSINLEVDPKIAVNLGDLNKDLNISISGDNGDDNNEDAAQSVRIKNHSKSYPVDGNDRIRLSNQYGKITVNTWDRHEIKVDIQIKAEAGNEDDAQKLVDAVQISDSKNGDQVSFRTSIERNNNGSWSLFNWGGSSKKHKLTINYVVFMPAKNDLNVEDSYGSIELPDLEGRVKISSSYGSVSAQNLSNASNDIEGSYGSLKIANMNGGKLDYSYGNAEIEDCTNLKADLSYGSFKLGRIRGTAEFNLSYVGGFKIGELANSLKKLSIDASYSGVALGVPAGNNFDFDITTSYGGFNYNDDKVTITSKTPPDGSRHIGTTRNYKGHVGKGSSEARVNIQTSYGGVNFE
ncbi:hypothetical protein [Mucilaginibacter sp.]|uniref:hypothetical protein n=1 Tax=Mucilaginibacter sp. TaxID=1882438 RepID=UPI003D0CEA6F